MDPITTRKIPSGGSKSFNVPRRPSHDVGVGRPPQCGRMTQAIRIVRMKITAMMPPGMTAARYSLGIEVSVRTP
jgi:hypothetical protein